MHSALLISKVIHTDLETDLIENPYVVTLCRRNNMVFALGVLISDQFFMTAAQPITYHSHFGFDGVYVRLAMLHNVDRPYYIEGPVINSYDHITRQQQDANFAVLRVSDFMHKILEFR